MVDISLYSNVKPREDVFDPKFDDLVAPELSDVYLGKAPKIYTDPHEFFSITYLTDSMKALVTEITNAFESGKGMTIPLYSFFGGGKTHSLIMLYHAFTSPEVARKYGLNVIDGVKVIVVGGKDSNTAPSPASYKDAKTLWGYIAKQLGKFDVVKSFDNDNMAPPKDKLEEVFKGEKVLILFDEIVWYLANLKFSIYKEYYTKCILFFENLASITTNLPVVVVITIPAEVTSEGKIQAEKGYEGVVEELAKRIERVGKVYRAPIETAVDLGNVLKKRLFKEVNDTVKATVKSKVAGYIESFKEYVDEKVLENFDDSYPFHPYYLELLKFLLERANMQKTRDGIRLSRMVIRNLWASKPKRSLILPSDIDVRDEKFKVLLLKGFEAFDVVVDTIKQVTKGPSIYFNLANYIFLSTYTYGLGLDPGNVKAALPDSKKAVTSVLDPLYLEEVALTPAEVKMRLIDMTEKSQNADRILPYMLSVDDRFWFTAFPDPLTICKKEKGKVLDADAITRLKEIIESLAQIPPEDMDKRKKNEYRGIISNYHVVDDLDHLIEDDGENYTLVIVWKPQADYDLLKKFIYEVPSGKSSSAPRKNANTIAVMFSESGRNKELLMDKMKEVMACERVDIRSYYRDEVSREVANKRLFNYVNGLRSSIYQQVFMYFDKLAYPTGVNDVQIVNLYSSEKTLLGIAEQTLKNEGKIIDENSFDFETLAYYLSNINIDIKNTQTSYPQLRSMFFTNPMLPWVSEGALKRAIINGLENYSIGILSGSKVYFKKVEGVVTEYGTELVNDKTTILPQRVAAEMQIEQLLQEEKEFEEEGKVHKIYYVIDTGEETIPLRELKERENWLDLFIIGKLRKVEEVIESGVTLDVEPKFIKAKRGETVTVKVKVGKIGSFNKKVIIEASKGQISQSEGLPPFEASLSLQVLTNEAITITAKYDNNSLQVKIPVEVIQEECERVVDFSTTASPIISKVEVLDMNNVINTLDQLRLIPGVKTVEGEVTIEDPTKVTVTVRPKGMRLDEFIQFLNRQVIMVGLKSSLSGRLIVNVKEGKPLDDKKKIAELASKNVIRVYEKVC